MFCCSSPACHFFLHSSLALSQTLRFASQALITAQLSYSNILFSDSHDFSDPLLLTILPHATKLSLSHYSFHLSIDNSLAIMSKSKLLCLICKSITSPHPIYSIFFPTKSKTHPPNQSGCHKLQKQRYTCLYNYYCFTSHDLLIAQVTRSKILHIIQRPAQSQLIKLFSLL